MKQIIVLLMVLALTSCQKRKPIEGAIEAENLSAEQIDSILTKFKFEYQSPIVLDSTDQVLIPISTRLLKKRATYSKDGYASYDNPRYWNVLFYNRKSGENRLLTEDKIRISNIHAKKDEDYDYGYGNRIMQNKIIYEIGDLDFNKDGILNEEDPEYLFSSDINGENLTRISPADEYLQYFEVIPKSKQILLRTLRDTNQDLVFDRKDEAIWYKADLINQEWQLNEVIDAVGRKKIETLYFDQWLKKK